MVSVPSGFVVRSMVTTRQGLTGGGVCWPGTASGSPSYSERVQVAVPAGATTRMVRTVVFVSSSGSRTVMTASSLPAAVASGLR